MTEFDKAAFLRQQEDTRRNYAHHYWRSRLDTPEATETAAFVTKLTKAIPPSDLVDRMLPLDIRSNFGTVTSLAGELGVSLEYPARVGNLLEQGFSEVRSAIDAAHTPLIGRDIPLERSIASVTHPRTIQSIAHLALVGEEAMRNRIGAGVATATDPETGVTFLSADVAYHHHTETFNRGCPFASRTAAIDKESYSPSPVFSKFVAYAGELVARLAVKKP